MIDLLKFQYPPHEQQAGKNRTPQLQAATASTPHNSPKLRSDQPIPSLNIYGRHRISIGPPKFDHIRMRSDHRPTGRLYRLFSTRSARRSVPDQNNRHSTLARAACFQP
ncbi:MAG TPA: hypothetical protein VNS79_00060 [Sphingobium sp.]|nr:hypothetical protein [Sphingobium sp.]